VFPQNASVLPVFVAPVLMVMKVSVAVVSNCAATTVVVSGIESFRTIFVTGGSIARAGCGAVISHEKKKRIQDIQISIQKYRIIFFICHHK
jgi:hypothetical protein